MRALEEYRLTLKAPVTPAVDAIHKYCFIVFQKIQALFSSKDKSKKSKCRLLQFLFGALRVKGFL